MFAKFKQKSISFKYMAFYTSGLIALTLIFSQGFLWLSNSSLSQQLNSIIRADSDSLVEYYDLNGLEGLTELLSHRLRTNPNTESIYLLTDRDFHPVLGNIREWPDIIDKSTVWGEVDWQSEVEWLELRYFHRTLSDGTHLLVGHRNSQIELFRFSTYFALIFLLICSLIVGAVFGIVFHRQLQKRINVIIDGCQKISAGDLDHRMQTEEKGDELNQVAITFNLMLDRIQFLMDGIKHVSDNIAHDLRTPLTRLHNKLENLHQRTKDRDSEINISEALHDVEELLSTFQSLLHISRLEKKQISQDIEEINLSQLCRDVAELYEPLAEEKQQYLIVEIQEGLGLPGYRDLLFQAISNLLDNAVKYSPAKSQIILILRQTSETFEVVIQDQGAGIPEDKVTKVFERFYRLDNSRHEKGNGLGLSMVAAIVELNQGDIHLANDNGLVVTISFPIPQEDEMALENMNKV
ncbi:ATP-binding protein [Curvivirga sp.]|uniref:ATP-binding protein n=1 Tax=Curvivirga sp. TaxID=2856848 RepID=UPI003B5B08D3